MTRARAILGSLLLVSLACGSASDPHASRTSVSIDPTVWQPEHLMLALGSHWVLPGSMQAISADTRTANIPIDRMAATAFVDRNGNRRIDSFSEPTGFCSGSPLQCKIDPLVAYAHRIDRSGLNELHQPYPVVQPFDAGGSPLDARVCDSTGTCASRTAGPYDGLAVEPYILTFCESIELTVSVDGADIVLPLEEPEPMKATAQIGGDHVSMETSLRIDRFLVWIRARGHEQIWWTSETSSGQVVVTDRMATAAFPSGLLESCSDCEIVVQAVHLDRSGAWPRVSEAQIAIALDEAGYGHE
jgi:hypothetical protein